jgi:hypothetical protein
MIGIDKKRIQKYRKRLNLSALIIFILSLWLIKKYNDTGYLETDKEMLEHDIVEKESEISKLRYKVDSLSKPKEEVIVKEQVPVKIKRTTPDTIKQLPKIDTIKKIESDTL